MKALLLVALCATGSWSIEEMIIGPGGLPWTAVIEESTKMGVDRDSILDVERAGGCELGTRSAGARRAGVFDD